MDASAHDLMERRTLASPGLASSLTSSSDGRQRLISLLTGVSGSRAAEALIKGIIWKFFGFLMASVALRAGSDCQQGADGEKLRDPQGTSDFQTFHGTTHILHAAEGETSLHAGRASGHRSSPSGILPDRPQITGRLQFPAHLFSHLRGGVLRELVDDLCIFESF